MTNRFFIGIDFPEEIKDELQSLKWNIPRGHWVPRENYHLTLKFIGEADSNTQQDIFQALNEVKYHPFNLQLKGIGFFPPRGEPHTLWVGVEDEENHLDCLHKKIESKLKLRGIEKERRKFTPHVAVAKLKGMEHQVGEFVQQYSLFRSTEIEIKHFVLFESFLRSTGSSYLKIQEFNL